MTVPSYDTTAEMLMQRGNTLAFIAVDPVTVVLVPRIRMMVSGAEHLVDDTPRDPQVMKLIMQSPAGGSIEQHSNDGTVTKMDFMLLGAWDSEGDIGDHWTDANGQEWEVTAIVPDNGYERRFIVESYGSYAIGG